MWQIKNQSVTNIRKCKGVEFDLIKVYCTMKKTIVLCSTPFLWLYFKKLGSLYPICFCKKRVCLESGMILVKGGRLKWI